MSCPFCHRPDPEDGLLCDDDHCRELDAWERGDLPGVARAQRAQREADAVSEDRPPQT